VEESRLAASGLNNKKGKVLARRFPWMNLLDSFMEFL